MAHRNPNVKSFLLGSSLVLSEMASLGCMAFGGDSVTGQGSLEVENHRGERNRVGEGLTLAAEVQSEIPPPSHPAPSNLERKILLSPLSFPQGQRLWLSGEQDARPPFLPPAFPVSTMQPLSLALTWCSSRTSHFMALLASLGDRLTWGWEPKSCRLWWWVKYHLIQTSLRDFLPIWLPHGCLHK